MNPYTEADLLRFVEKSRPILALNAHDVTKGGVFILQRTTDKAEAYITEAIARGAAFIVTDPNAPVINSPLTLQVPSPRHFAAELCAARYGTATLPFPLIGVTGTNGKTTTTYLLEHLFISKKLKAGVIGTIAFRWPGHTEEATLTTPDSTVLYDRLFRMQQAGVQIAAMELSSHGLDQCRADCIPFAGAVFTNLTQDHLDYHKTFEDYFNAKSRLFLSLPRQDKAMGICTDDEWGRRLASMVVERFKRVPHLVTFGLNDGKIDSDSEARHLHGRVLASTTKGLRLAMYLKERGDIRQEWELSAPLIGKFNAANLLGVQAVALGMGFTPKDFDCFSDFAGVPGRLERIPNPRGLDIFVDFAHTPDALAKVLNALREAGFKRIVCLFGCGGDRDATKRPLMGMAVAANADAIVLTSDNPRHENPLDIIDSVRQGLAGAHEVVIEVDRRTAIMKALAMTNPGDALLVAGKGHETTQQIGDTKHPFSDQATIRELCACH